jgi:hypothetical protein
MITLNLLNRNGSIKKAGHRFANNRVSVRSIGAGNIVCPTCAGAISFIKSLFHKSISRIFVSKWTVFSFYRRLNVRIPDNANDSGTLSIKSPYVSQNIRHSEKLTSDTLILIRPFACIHL